MIAFAFVIVLHTTKAHAPGLFKLPKRKCDVNAKFVLLLYTHILLLIKSGLSDPTIRDVNSLLAKIIIL